MIKNSESLSMPEALGYVKKAKGNDDLVKFAKEFVKISPEDATKLRESLSGLNIMKLNAVQISKIIDIMPEDKEDVNKIFVDVKLDDDETNKVLDTVKEFK